MRKISQVREDATKALRKRHLDSENHFMTRASKWTSSLPLTRHVYARPLAPTTEMRFGLDLVDRTVTC